MILTSGINPVDVHGFVWDVGTLSWIKETQAGGGGGGTVDQGAGGLDPWLVSVDGPVAVTGTFWQATQPVSAASLPLPSGAATESKQDTGNTSLASIDTKLTNPLPISGSVTTGGLTDAQLRAADVKVTLDGEVVPVTGTFFQVTQPISGTVSVSNMIPAVETGLATSAKQDTAQTTLTSLDNKTPALGQALAAASIPVVLTAAQISTITPPAAIVGFATSANQATEIASLASIDAKITNPLPISGTVSVTEPVTVDATDLDIRNLAFATDKVDIGGSSSVGITNANLDVALSTLLKPADTLAAVSTITNPVSVINAGTFAVQNTETRPATSTQTVSDWSAISDTDRSLQLLAANTSRRGLTIRNSTDKIIPIREDGIASAIAYTEILYPGDSYILDYPASTALLSLYIPEIPSGLVYATERS